MISPKLLHGPYTPPALQRGDRATCLYHDADVMITGWTDARISWPRCRRVGERCRPGHLVNEELARAVRCESSIALQYWFGVHEKTVRKWRCALGVARNNDGSARLRRALNDELAARKKGRPPPSRSSNVASPR